MTKSKIITISTDTFDDGIEELKQHTAGIFTKQELIDNCEPIIEDGRIVALRLEYNVSSEPSATIPVRKVVMFNQKNNANITNFIDYKDLEPKFQEICSQLEAKGLCNEEETRSIITLEHVKQAVIAEYPAQTLLAYLQANKFVGIIINY